MTKKILYMYPMDNEGTKLMLEDDLDVKVTTCTTGKEILEQIQKESFDIITMNTRMSPSNGKVIAEIRKSQKNKNAKIICATGGWDQDKVLYKKGFDDVLRFPKDDIVTFFKKYCDPEPVKKQFNPHQKVMNLFSGLLGKIKTHLKGGDHAK